MAVLNSVWSSSAVVSGLLAVSSPRGVVFVVDISCGVTNSSSVGRSSSDSDSDSDDDDAELDDVELLDDDTELCSSCSSTSADSSVGAEPIDSDLNVAPVSYTHLTLPTIYSV